ncbi:alpha/beta fold hydrolase [Undibacterium arcticum]
MSGLYTLNEVVADAIRLLDHLRWDQAHLLGHSIGALVGQMIAVAAPGRIRSIVSLAGMNARGASRDPARMRMLDEAAHHVSQRAAVIHMGVGKRYGMAFAQQVSQSAWEAIAPQACADYAADAALTDIHTQVDGSEIPLLALVGAHDPGCTEQLARDTTLRWYRNAILEVVSDAGHYPMIEAPARTLAAVETFLRSVSKTSGQ